MKKLRTLFYTFGQGIANIFRNSLFSLASIATIGACLFLFGLFLAVLMNFQHIVKEAEQNVSVTVFFDEGLSTEEMEAIGQKIKARVEVADVKFVSSEEAWEYYKEKYIGEYADGFPDNPLEASSNFEIYLNDVSMQDSLVTYLENLDGVRLVNKSELTASTLSSVNLLIAYVSMAIIAILFAVSIFLISNTVMIGINVRRQEIAIMKYVGATDFFVRAPFIIECMLIGLIGAVIPLVIIYYLYDVVVNYISNAFALLTSYLNFLPREEVFMWLIPVSLLLGIGIGFLGSIVTVRRHLRV